MSPILSRLCAGLFATACTVTALMSFVSQADARPQIVDHRPAYYHLGSHYPHMCTSQSYGGYHGCVLQPRPQLVDHRSHRGGRTVDHRGRH